MENLFIKETASTPEISFNANQGFLQIKGVSLPEDSVAFYEPLFNYFENEKDELSTKNISVSLKFLYINTSTTGLLSRMLQMFERLVKAGLKISVKWYYEKEDIDMGELGNDFKSTTHLEFTVIPCDEI